MMKNETRELFCNTWEDIVYSNELGEEPCILCPFADRCYSGHNGLLDYIDEVKENVD